MLQAQYSYYSEYRFQLREDEAAWRTAEDAGRFSLAGSQGKTALLLDGARWGVPAGRELGATKTRMREALARGTLAW